MWLLEQLSELLTPRTAKKFRKMGGKFKGLAGGGGLSDSDSDSGENDRFDQEVNLSEPSYLIMRQWRHEASKRTQGKFARRVGGLSETSDSDMDGSRPKWPPARLTPSASALMKGWLAATRAVRSSRNMGDREARLALSSSEGLSSDTDTDRTSASRSWGTPVLHTGSQRLLLDWLHRARNQIGVNLRRVAIEGGSRRGDKNLLKGVIFSSSDESSSGEGSSDDGEMRRQPVYLKPGSMHIMRQWLAAIQARRAGGIAALGQGLDPMDRDPALLQRQRQQRSALSSSSDSDGGDDPRLTMGPFDSSVPAQVQPSSQRIVKWWLKEMREKVVTERAKAERERQARLQDDDDDDEDSSGDSGPDIVAGGQIGAGPTTAWNSGETGGNMTDPMSTNPSTSDQFRSGTDFDVDSSDY